MAPPRTYHCEALILKHVPFGEADLLVTFFTRERGKIRAVARGARRSNSKLVGHLEPLTQVNLSLAHVRAEAVTSRGKVLPAFHAPVQLRHEA